jgi:hypothetical protein
MKRLLLITLLMASTAAFAGYIVDTTTTNPMSADKIPVGRLKGGTSYTVTVDGLAEYAVKSGKSARFAGISTNSISVPQGIDEQSIELFEAAENGENRVIIKPMANMSANRIITIGNHGLYVDGVQKLAW